MKRSHVMALMMSVTLMSGCSFALWAKIQNQLRNPEHYFLLACDGDRCTWQFLEPIIPRSDLAGLGLPEGDPAESAFRATYILQVNDMDIRPVTVGLRFSQDRLQSISIPAIFYSLLGRENIFAMLRVSGGAKLAEGDIESISIQKVMAALEKEGIAIGPMVDRIKIKLVPTAARSRSLMVVLARTTPAENYKSISLLFKMEQEAAISAR
jgi:hypothetical protein